MDLHKIVIELLCLVVIDGLVVNEIGDKNTNENDINANDVFNGVYTECFMHLSYSCLQKKTLLYLKELNELSEVAVIGDYVKFVKVNDTKLEDNENANKHGNGTDELAFLIDIAVDNFFNNHIIKFSALGRDVSMSRNAEEFVGRKKRKGGGGADQDGDHDFGKKKMMMMAMMCMKMKLMMMVPAMMGMMGMMSFKGMIFSMLSFMISKLLLIMKLLEKKGGAEGAGANAGVGGADGGWATAGGAGGAWMPAGGQDYGGGGGYDANGQWQSRSILELEENNKPLISYVTPIVRHNEKMTYTTVRKFNTEDPIKRDNDEPKSRKKRDLIGMLQNSYIYWMNKILGMGNNRRNNINYPKHKIVNGVKYVFYPKRPALKLKMPNEVQASYTIKNVDEGFKPIITAEDYNKGEIVEGTLESRMNRKKLHKMKKTVNDTVEDNPWQ